MNLKEFKELSHTSDKIYKFVRPIILTGLMVLTYTCLLLETFKYPGFIAKYFFIDSKIYFTLTIILILFSDSKSRFLNFTLKANGFLLPILSIIYLVLVAFEGAYFTNYILSTLGIHLDGLVVVVLFSLAIFVADKYKNLLSKNVRPVRILYPLMIFAIVFFLVKNVSYVADESFNRNFYILFHLQNSYDQRMYYQWGDFYRFMTFVKNNTPTDTTIIGPPEEDPWLMGSGNDRFVRVFLYPRKIVSVTKIIPNVKAFGPNTYILITWGKEECKPEGCHGWPRQDIPARKIFYKDPDSEKVIETKENVIYKWEDDKYVYGLIKL
jgi:hypothetical protein